MRASRRRKLEAQTQPHLAPAERIELFGMAKIGKAPVAKNVAAAAVAVAVGTMLGGTAVVMFSQKSVYLVLTDRQLVFFGMNTSTGGPAEFITKVPRAALAAEVLPGSGLMLKIRLDIAALHGQSAGSLLLSVAPLPPSNKAAGRSLASSLSGRGARGGHRLQASR